jgi:hypothetical protein
MAAFSNQIDDSPVSLTNLNVVCAMHIPPASPTRMIDGGMRAP